ncbi:hypothetical protein C7S16_0303 [Burkholderia thailandensis]|uniref:Uncharacterized protein n=1 Tax=Burkholderia thailandensis TaxID=57975 RepID=A0AAW9CYI1_BURTH|nr:hypothetical protein [Burkholderia thailandensis]MDW9255690.1 hypothetical protein [Burkholderia thailandensis]
MAEGSHLRSVSSVGCAIGRRARRHRAGHGAIARAGAGLGCPVGVSRRILKRFVRGCRASEAGGAQRGAFGSSVAAERPRASGARQHAPGTAPGTPFAPPPGPSPRRAAACPERPPAATADLSRIIDRFRNPPPPA